MKASKVLHPKKTILAIGAVLVVMVVMALVFRTLANRPSMSVPYIPESMSSSLLFDPYVPGWLPDGYDVDAASYSAEGQALVFSAIKAGSQPITISEQAVPKNFDMNSFLTSNATDTTRLDGAKYTAVFGKTNARKQNLTSITADSTWVLVTLPESITKDDAKRLVDNLVRQ